MVRKSLLSFVLLLSIFIISGCGTAPKKIQQEVTGIKARVDTLESRVEGVESKQVDIEKTTAQQMQMVEDLKVTKDAQSSAGSSKANFGVKERSGKSNIKVRDIQVCLKNAGFYQGSIDGVKGKATRKAIRDFQASHGLKVDGVVGANTWELLNRYANDSQSARGDEADTK